MSRLQILRYPDARLHKTAAPVAEVNASIRSLVANMAETMYAAPGVGLAATQVDVHLQVIVIDASDSRDKLLTLINPEIVAAMAATISGLISVSSLSRESDASMTITCRCTSTWVAARPTPGAAYMVSAMFATKLRMLAFTSATGAAVLCKRASG